MVEVPALAPGFGFRRVGEFGFHDAAIVFALILFALGLRKSARFWRLKPGDPIPPG